MRDPKRIDEMLERIRTIWENSPDLRLLQLLINSLSRVKPEFFYFVEDDDLIKFLNECYKEDKSEYNKP